VDDWANPTAGGVVAGALYGGLRGGLRAMPLAALAGAALGPTLWYTEQALTSVWDTVGAPAHTPATPHVMYSWHQPGPGDRHYVWGSFSHDCLSVCGLPVAYFCVVLDSAVAPCS
jgi:hypothetical protein